ncbi:hypothetical protein FRC01_010704, partial [Tulasnella sp. 417]
MHNKFACIYVSGLSDQEYQAVSRPETLAPFSTGRPDRPPVMKTGSLLCNAISNETAKEEQNAIVPPIAQLPVELLTQIFYSALPPVTFRDDLIDAGTFLYVRRLYAIRLISKQWQEIIDGIPTFWTFVISTLPPHVIGATMKRSQNGPLVIVYPYRALNNRHDRVSARYFLDSVAHTFPRWSAYSGPMISGYFDRPAPHLRSLILRHGESRFATFDLLGGDATNLRHVDLESIAFRWKVGIFAQLKVLKLVKVTYRDFTTTHLLEILRASPDLEQLKIVNMLASIDHQPSYPIITLRCLRYINFNSCYDDFIGAMLRRIRAPSCSEFFLSIWHRDNEPNLHRIWDEESHPFQGLLHDIHVSNGSSELKLTGDSCEWRSLGGPGAENSRRFSVFATYRRPTDVIRWVESVLQNERGLSIRFTSRADFSHEILDTIASMRCVTKVEIEHIFTLGEFLSILKFIGEPIRSNPSLPSLPCLRELLLTGIGWTAQDVLNMVYSRFNSLSEVSAERIPLKIYMARGAFSRYASPRPILDLATLAQIRETNGVECVEFVGSEELDGSLAIIWNGETSTP